MRREELDGKQQHDAPSSGLRSSSEAGPSSNGPEGDLEHGLGSDVAGHAAEYRFQAERLQIVYRNLKYTVSIKKKGVKGVVKKEILRDVSGIINSGRLTFVMGASGAGKTTLLNMLAGHTLSGAAVMAGSITVNGEECSSERMRRLSGFVHQEDVILDTMTVREALNFAAQLNLPNTMTSEEKQQRAMDIAELLGLHKSLDNIVGSATLKGISGGEKRRLSLGMEAVTNPSILYLDEPTSGLDSATAFKVTKILANLAHRYGRTIVCTIHQPSSDIFHLADDLIVLAEGQVLYHGTVDEMVPYFSELGYHCPTYTNPADFLFREVLHAGKDTEDMFDFIHKRSPASVTDMDRAAQMHEAEGQRVQGVVASWEKSRAAEAF